MGEMKILSHNETYIKIWADSSTEMELSDYFTFEVEGAKFMPAY